MVARYLLHATDARVLGVNGASDLRADHQQYPSKGALGGYDNALAETINRLYKAAVIHRREPWKTKQAVELATLEWVAWFNHHRLMVPLG